MDSYIREHCSLCLYAKGRVTLAICLRDIFQLQGDHWSYRNKMARLCALLALVRRVRLSLFAKVVPEASAIAPE